MDFIEYKYLNGVNGFSKLFIDYVTNFKKVEKFYEYNFGEIDNFKKRCEYLKKSYFLRDDIYDILLEQNRNFDCNENTFLNLSYLKDENTFAIVTGQQVGILGGPLYTFYKIISLIKLTEILNSRLSEYKFIPIFWLECEDHDFEEVNKINLLSIDNQLKTLTYQHKGKPKQFGAVGKYKFANIEEFFNQIKHLMQNTDYKESLFNFYSKSYTNDSTFENAFVRFYTQLLPDSGIIFINPNNKRVKNLLKNIFKKEIQTYPKTCQLIIDISANLENEYHGQIKPRPVNLFMHYKEGRYLIEPNGNEFALKGTRRKFKRDELETLIETNPELLSPNVVLRPISQDTLLPTVAYIAGPSEIAYFAQLKPVYNEFSLQMPIIYPRASITLLEDKVARILEKYELSLVEIFKDTDKVSQHVIELISDIKIESLFNDTLKRIQDILSEMKYGLSFIDSTLLGSLETTREKINQHISVLKEKANSAQRQKFETALRQVEKVMNNLYPNRDLQERVLNLINFMNKYGMDLNKKLLNAIDLEKFMHQVIELP